MRKRSSFLFATMISVGLSAQTPITYPCDLSTYVNQQVKITNEMVVISNYSLGNYNEISVAPQRLYAPTEVCLPGSELMNDLATSNSANQLKLLSSSYFNYTDANNTCRTGQMVTNIQGYVTKISNNIYGIRPTQKPTFAGNERISNPSVSVFHNLIVTSSNLQYYIADSTMWASSNGAKNRAEFNRQRRKCALGLLATKADVFALCEIGEGVVALEDLKNLLNELSNSSVYQYVNDKDTQSSAYTKVGFIYNSSKVTPYGTFVTNNISGVSSFLKKRKAAMGFELISNGERFIVNMNHFKSKGSGSGDDADQGDGQGASNATRTKEALGTISFINSVQKSFSDKDVLVLGDLNSYSSEDPLTVLEEGGLVNQLKRFSSTDYSYSYQGTVGYLDHSLATTSMSDQVVSSFPWHVNADEPSYLNYSSTKCNENDPFRYSDHDPILTAINLGLESGDEAVNENSRMRISLDKISDYLVLNAMDIDRVVMYDAFGRIVFQGRNEVVGDYFVLPLSGKKGVFIIKATGKSNTWTEKILIP